MSYTEAQLDEIRQTMEEAAAPLKAKLELLKTQLEEERQKKQGAHRDLIRANKRVETHIAKAVRLSWTIDELRNQHDAFRNWIYKVLNEMDKILPCAYTEPWMCSPIRQQGVELVRPRVKTMHNERGMIKKSLEEAGVKFQKSPVSGVWSAELDGKEIGRHKELGHCVRQAAEATGEM